jgi:hypothetical protein
MDSLGDVAFALILMREWSERNPGRPHLSPLFCGGEVEIRSANFG